ncbi:hypothetical protein GCM10022207_29380 [Streptomyces lannensis]|uniref:Uncharacterized protein n=1 Tax=Streptomyces lannensis TaxID=766498 RepID=A0ABP7K4K8_9ACTN
MGLLLGTARLPVGASGIGRQPVFKVLDMRRAARVEKHLKQPCRPSVPDAAAVHFGPAPMGGLFLKERGRRGPESPSDPELAVRGLEPALRRSPVQ